MRMINLTPVLGAVLIFAACKKEIGAENAGRDASNIVAPVESGYNVKVDGNLVTGQMQGIIAPDSDKLVINAGDDASISIILPSDVKPGTYDLQYLGDYMATLKKNDNSLVSESGSVTITERNDSQIKGTFSFDAADAEGAAKAVVSAGSFAANYTR
ncbi:MAG: DUF6252 family protein [Flavitalea sp.]